MNGFFDIYMLCSTFASQNRNNGLFGLMSKTNVMKRKIVCLFLAAVLALPLATPMWAQTDTAVTTDTFVPDTEDEVAADLLSDEEIAKAMKDSIATDPLTADDLADPVENENVYQALKRKFIEGNAGFMSLVALALVLGLAFCIERIIYLTLSEVNAQKLMEDVDRKIGEGDIEGAKDICRETRGPVASICYQGLLRVHESLDNIERSVESYGAVQAANLEKGCSWITLFIAIAPSLGFLGTVIGMVMAFDQIQAAEDISPTIVASGMKVALITTIFGIIVALILQMFYNYILNKIERLTVQMEESAVTLLDALAKYKSGK